MLEADMDSGPINQGKGQPKCRAKAKAKVTRAKDSPKGKGKGQEPKHSEHFRKDANKQDRKCFVCGKHGHVGQDCEHRAGRVNEVTVSTDTL